MSEKRLLNALLSIGFTQNTAKAYMVLLEESPLSGYAIALKAGVTRARTYDALERLVELGYVRARPGRPVMYVPVPIEEIVASQSDAEARHVERAKAALAQLEPKRPPLESMICVTGYHTILQNILSNIEDARQTISLYVRKEEYEQLCGKLREAADRGVRINAVFAVDQKDDIVCDLRRILRMFSACTPNRRARAIAGPSSPWIIGRDSSALPPGEKRAWRYPRSIPRMSPS